MELQIIEAQERKLALQEREVSLLNQRVQLELKELERAEYWAKKLAGSDLVPKDFKNNPANCFIAIQWGKDLGLAPLQATQNIAVINGRPALWGDAVPALVISSKQCEYINMTFENNTAICKVKRIGQPEHISTFSMQQAKVAGLLEKQGPWKQYPDRMLQNRARAFALRDVFPDVLKGLYTAEELIDSLPQRNNNNHAATPLIEQQKPDFVLEFYPDDKFTANAPQWQSIIESGKKTANELIDSLSMKINLTAEQKQIIVAWESPTNVTNENNSFVDEMEKTEANE